MYEFRRYSLHIGLLIMIICCLPPSGMFDNSAFAATRTLAWSIVDTPGQFNNVITSPGEINGMALGPDGTTIYCTDIPNKRLFMSTDAGYTWREVQMSLAGVGAILPVWHIAIAPDDVKFAIAITDNQTGPPSGGPKRLFWTIDGGNNWQFSAIAPALAPGEYISCLDISKSYGANGQRDVAVGTRNGAGSGRVYTIQYSTNLMGNWAVQTGPITGMPNEDVTSLKFSPNYDQDFTIAVVSCTPLGTYHHLGLHAPATNTTQWDIIGGFAGYPLILWATDSNHVINTDLELPSDFNASVLTQRVCFASILADNSTAVRYVDSGIINGGNNITPPITANRIYSIAYKGSISSGTLLACENGAAPSRGRVTVWQCNNAQSLTPGAAVWLNSDVLKSPTGGANTGRANGILAWSPDGNTAYCGTSSENATVGGTGWAPGRWPQSKTTGAALDESAFSRSVDDGISWNQSGLIDTVISRLSDVAVLEKATDATGDYSVLYVSSLNNGAAAFSFDSVWRSKSDPLGGAWERVLIWNSSDAGTILRVNPRLIPHSKVIVFADLTTASILHSLDEGQFWIEANANIPVSDIGLQDDNKMYVLGDYTVRKITRSGASWIIGRAISTNLVEAGHTISIPLKADIVIIGTTGLSENYVAWADFNKTIIKFTQLAALPGAGDTHVVADSEFHNNKMIYAAMRNIPGNDGTVFRWTLDKSTQWDVLEPINRAFYGSQMLDNVYYASWNFNTTSTADGAGVDRTLYPRVAVPPPPEWNELPVTDNISTKIAVKFTREPTALKESTNTYNTLWAIDDEVYQYSSADNRTGCLWAYVDSISKLGPWPTSPPPGSLIGPDTVTGRNKQIDFKWRPLKDIFGYDLLIAKDADFTLILTQNIANQPVDDRTGAYIIIPGDQEAPGCWLTPGALETGRPYYWRVRGSRTIDGYTVHSPWSATMSFSVQPGFIVQSRQHGPTLLTPQGSCVDCRPPIRFNWAPVEGARKYEITLAKDPELKDVIISGSSAGTAFEYKEKLEFSRTYYWQVRVSEPAASDPSPVGSFILTEAKAAPSTPATPAKTDKSEPAVSGFWIWIIIVIVTVVMVLINVLAFISRNRS